MDLTVAGTRDSPCTASDFELSADKAEPPSLESLGTEVFRILLIFFSDCEIFAYA